LNKARVDGLQSRNRH